MSTNLQGANINVFFSTAGTNADTNAPYTNTGGANAAAILTMNTSTANVTATEAAGAFSGAGNAITVHLSGPGEFIFQGANGYTGGTSIGTGTTLSIGDPGALGAGVVTLGGDSVLESTVTGTLSNGINAIAGGVETIEAATGTTLTLQSTTGAYNLGGAGSVLSFGSATDTGTVVFAGSAAGGVVSFSGAVAIAGGTLVLGGMQLSALDFLKAGFTVGTGATAATLDIAGQTIGLVNLSGDASGVITDNGAAATLTALGNVSTAFAGIIKDGTGALALEVENSANLGDKLTLTNTNTYSGGTTIDAVSELSIGNIGALGSGAVDFKGSSSILESTASGTLTNAIDILAGASAAIEATAGQTLTLGGASFYANGGTGTSVHFGSATDTGTVVLDTQSIDSYDSAGGVSIDGGTLSIASAVAADLVKHLSAGVTFTASGTTLEAKTPTTLSTPITIDSGVSATLEALHGYTLSLYAAQLNMTATAATTLNIGSATDTGTVVAYLSSINDTANQDFVVINGGKLSVFGGLSSGLLNLGGLTFAGNNTVLEAQASMVEAAPLTIDSGVSATIEALAGAVLTLHSTAMYELGGVGTTLHFGSDIDTGTVLYAPAAVSSYTASGAVSVDGGTLLMGTTDDNVLDNLQGGFTVGSGSTTATLDLGGHSNTFCNLSGDNSGVITDNGAAATLTVFSTVNTTFNGEFVYGGGALTLEKRGIGTLTLTGDDSFAGGLIIDGGILESSADNSLGVAGIILASNAYSTLKLDANVDPSNTITLTDGTSAIDFSGQSFAYGDKLSLLAVTAWQLKNAAGDTIETLNLNGAFSATNLMVGADGAGGTEIAAAYTAAAVTANEFTIRTSATTIFISDTAAHIATNLTAIDALINLGSVASIFTSFASFADGGTAKNLAVIGAGNTITLGGGIVSLYGTGNLFDTVDGQGTVYLEGAQANLNVSSGDVIEFGAGASNVATLSWAGSVASYVIMGFAAADTIKLTGLTTSYAPTTTGVVDPATFALAINGNVVTQTNLDNSKLVSHFNVAGQSYTTIVRSFDKSGDLTAVEHEGITGSPYVADTTLYSGPGTTGNIVSGNDLFYTGQASGETEADLDGSNNLLRVLYAYSTSAPATQTGFEADYVAGQLADGVSTYLAPAGAPYATFDVEYDNNYQYVGAVYNFTYAGQTYDEAQYSYTAGAQPKLTEATFSQYTGSNGPSVASFFYDSRGALSATQYAYATVTGQAYTSDAALYNSSNVLIADQTSGYTTTKYSSQTYFYNSSGAVTQILRDFTNPALAGSINGQAYNSYEKILNPSFAVQATSYHLDNGGNVYVGVASGVSSPTFGGAGGGANALELSNTLYGGDWTITGGGTGETFNFASFFNQAEITDYGAAFGGATDVVSVSTQSFANWTTMLGDASASGGGANTTFTSTTTGDKLTLDGVTLSQLQNLTANQASADFLFHG